MFVSLGMHCCVKEHIKTLSAQKNTLPTNLFDNVVSSFDSVTKILGAPPPCIDTTQIARYHELD
jgi:hypothetical protein